MDVIKYIFRYIPQFIIKDGKEYHFIMFINHAHYDFRFCYETFDKEHFCYLVENIGSQAELLNDLKWLRSELKKDGLLDSDYATPEGYTYKKYLEWSKT